MERSFSGLMQKGDFCANFEKQLSYMPEKNQSKKQDTSQKVESKESRNESSRIEKTKNWEIVDTTRTSIIKKSQDGKNLYTTKAK